MERYKRVNQWIRLFHRIHVLKDTPNDMELGKKIRELYRNITHQTIWV